MRLEEVFISGDVVQVKSVGSRFDLKWGYVKEVKGSRVLVRLEGTDALFEKHELIMKKEARGIGR